MHRTLGGQEVWLSVPSAGRPEAVHEMQAKFGPITWYVPSAQWDRYRSEGAAALAEGSAKHVVPVRNQMLLDAWAKGLPCVQLDDDINWAKKIIHFGKERNEVKPVRVLDALTEVVLRTVDSPYRLGGVPPTNNAFFSNRRTSTRHHTRSHVWVVQECECFVDKNLKVKFDYDYTLQHILNYGGVCRCDDLIFDADFGKRPGGHVDTRTREIEEQDIRYLQQKWGSKIIQRNPKREGEVLMKVPTVKREVLT